MIIHPTDWFKKYEEFAYPGCNTSVDITEIIDLLKEVIYNTGVNHLAYSGGVDSTILLCLMSDIFYEVNTYTISSRKDNKDIYFSRLGSNIYESDHHEFIVEPNKKETDKFTGDNAVRQLFENVINFTDKIICGDGVDEFMCGYHKHKDLSFDTYSKFLKELLPNHLIPLNIGSMNVKVFLPYLDNKVVGIMKNVALTEKVDHNERKKIINKIAKRLGIEEKIIYRHKYGFIDAFIEKDKQ